MGTFFDLIKEGQKHPFFNLLLAVSLVGFVSFSFDYFAVADETTKSISENVKLLNEIKTGMDRNALESKIRSIESEMFQLEGVQASGQATARDQGRLSHLRSELGTVGRELKRIDMIQYRAQEGY